MRGTGFVSPARAVRVVVVVLEVMVVAMAVVIIVVEVGNQKDAYSHARDNPRIRTPHRKCTSLCADNHKYRSFRVWAGAQVGVGYWPMVCWAPLFGR